MLAGVPAALVALAMLALAPLVPLAGTAPEFRLGFKLLADQVPTLAGEPLEEERHNPANGDALELTTTGFMVWRKADNWTAFTNGWRSWVNGPLGLQERGNDERFPWEASLSESIERMQGTAGKQGTSLPSPGPNVEPAATFQIIAAPSRGSEYPAGVIPSATARIPQASPPPTVVPTPTPRQLPSPSSPTAKPSATARPSPTTPPTPRSFTGGTINPNPAGEWVTSVSSRTNYYTSRDSSYWKSWAEQNRIWFATEAALLAAFPGRVRR